MLKIAHSLKEINFSQLMEIYLEGNLEKTEDGISLLQAEQEFYAYLKESFFCTAGAVYCIWLETGTYVSALRLEPYRDGWLLEALETKPEYRRLGYALNLIRSVQMLGEYKKIYSHIHKNNRASLDVHTRCGFRKISDSAAYIDGSVNSRACTVCWER